MRAEQVAEPAASGLRQRCLSALALVALALWVAWWVASVVRGSLILGQYTNLLPMPWLASDFVSNIDHVARVKAAGINPYLHPPDLFCALFPYPPTVLRLFGWVNLASPPSAVKIWLSVLAAVVVSSGYGAWRRRRSLGVSPVPSALAVAVVAYSAPATSALERGQLDPLLAPVLAAAAWLLGGGGVGRELAAGALLGAAAWVKYYPGAILFGLLALRRWRGAAAFLIVAGAIGLIDRVEVARSIENGRALAKTRQGARIPVHALSHSITGEWSSLDVVTRLPPLRRIPGPVAAFVLIGPAIALVARRVSRAGGDRRLTAPFFFWLTAAATFAMPYSNDYNLMPLVLAAVAVWDRRDPPWVHVVLASLLVCWQPLALPISGQFIFAVKLAALYAVGASLSSRCEFAPSAPIDPFLAGRHARASSPSSPAQSRS